MRSKLDDGAYHTSAKECRRILYDFRGVRQDGGVPVMDRTFGLLLSMRDDSRGEGTRSSVTLVRTTIVPLFSSTATSLIIRPGLIDVPTYPTVDHFHPPYQFRIDVDVHPAIIVPVAGRRRHGAQIRQRLLREPYQFIREFRTPHGEAGVQHGRSLVIVVVSKQLSQYYRAVADVLSGFE